ncbi:serine hydrolase domain-containing protein [Bacillus sp. JCM 19041]|uniref:serine hydrolase domain-containing protein n=1 Tax=Bacillus sp. JCM 19041 TaxID=1460637 RepID=UPI000ADFD5F2
MLDQGGQSFSYSNDGYALLGIVIERVSGLTYEQYMDSHIFQPLGMKSSFFDPPSSMSGRLVYMGSM